MSLTEWKPEWRAKTEHAEASNAQVRKLEHMSATEEFEACGRTFVVFPTVFSPAVSTESSFFCANIPKLAKGARRFLEVGSGSGCISVLVALDSPETDVHACDISPQAVANTKANAARHGISDDRFHVIKSDVFDSLDKGILFDVIFWNCPWEHTEKSIGEMSMVERAIRDPYYMGLEKYVRQGRRFLTADGRLLLGFSPEIGIIDTVIAIAKSAGWRGVRVLASEEHSAGGDTSCNQVENASRITYCILEVLR